MCEGHAEKMHYIGVVARLKNKMKNFLPLALMMAGSLYAANPLVGKPAPAFSFPGLTSKDTLTLSAFHGKVVLLDFWASWCLPCRKLMPMLSQIKERRPALEILAVSIDVDKTKALSFLRDSEFGLKDAWDSDQSAAKIYGVEWMPACFLIDKQGRLRFRHDSYSGEDLKKIEREAKLLLNEPGTP